MRHWVISATSAAVVFAGSAFAADDHGAHCGQESIEGNWAFTLSGTLGTGAARLPGAAVGAFTIDRRGGVSGLDTTSVDGSVFSETFTGTAMVREDCTGSASINASVAGPAHFDLVVTAKHQEMMLIRKDPGTTIFGSARRQ